MTNETHLTLDLRISKHITPNTQSVCNLIDNYNEDIDNLNEIFEFLVKDSEWEIPLYALENVIKEKQEERDNIKIHKCPLQCKWFKNNQCEYQNYINNIKGNREI